jgi:hypothetical protein
MRKIFISTLFVLAATAAFGQGTFFSDSVRSSAFVYGQQVEILIPGAEMTVCFSPAVMSNGVCTNRIALYSDIGLTQMTPNPLLLDSNSNYNFFASASALQYTITLNGKNYGPYTINTGLVVGPPGPQGPTGATGPQGSAGAGVPAGGGTGQVLAKIDSGSYDTTWSTPFNPASPGAIGSTSPGTVNATSYSVSGSPLASANLSDTATLVRSNGVNSGNIAVGVACPSGAPAGSICAATTINGTTPVIDVRAFGADPTGTTDSTAAIYAATAYSCSAPQSIPSARSIPVYFSPGQYLVTNLDLSGLSCAPMWYGLDDNSTQLWYNGPGGYDSNGVPTFLVRWSTQISFGGIEGIGFYGENSSTGALAAYTLWLPAGPDNGFRVNHARFNQSLSHAIAHTPILYTAIASTTASSTTVSVPNLSAIVSQYGWTTGTPVYLLGAGTGGPGGTDLITTIASINTGANTITTAAAPTVTLTGNAQIAAKDQLGLTNWHMDRLRFDGIGGCQVYITGSTGDENRPFTMSNFTTSTVAPGGSTATWLTANSLWNGTNWGDATLCTSNGEGISARLENARVELSVPLVVQGNDDNGSLVRSFNESWGGGPLVQLVNVSGYASGLDEPMGVSSNGKLAMSVVGGGNFTANGCMKNAATQTFYGDKYCGGSGLFNAGYNSGTSGGIALGSQGQNPNRIEALPDPPTSNSYAKFHVNDVVIHPASEASPGAKGVFRTVTATGDLAGTITSTGRCQGHSTTLTTAATITSTTTFTVSTLAGLWLQPGDNITILAAGPSAANLDTQVASISYTTNTVTVSNTMSISSGTNYTVNTQACTFHELAGAQTGTAAPTSGWWFTGEKVWNTSTTSGQPIYWICSAGGNPGTWVNGPNYGASSFLGGTLTSELVTVASASGSAGFNLAPGTAPSAPNNGDCWTTSAGLFCQINGSTVGPMGPTAASGSRTASTFCSGTASSSSTIQMTGFGAWQGSGACTGTGALNEYTFMVPSAGTVSNLSVRCGTTGVNSSSGVFTLYYVTPGSTTETATGLTVTYGSTAANTLMQDTTHTYSYAAGDLFALKFTTQSSETLGNCNASFNY